MHSLGIPTTRSLAVISTGEIVYRENELPGAILTRMASSHIRVEPQFASLHQEKTICQALLDYTINRHFPDIQDNQIKPCRCSIGLWNYRRSLLLIDESGLHPRSDEHRQYGDMWRSHRLRSLCIHGCF